MHQDLNCIWQIKTRANKFLRQSTSQPPNKDKDDLEDKSGEECEHKISYSYRELSYSSDFIVDWPEALESLLFKQRHHLDVRTTRFLKVGQLIQRTLLRHPDRLRHRLKIHFQGTYDQKT